MNLKTWVVIDIKKLLQQFFSKDPMNSEDQYSLCMNKLKSGAPSKILKQGKR